MTEKFVCPPLATVELGLIGPKPMNRPDGKHLDFYYVGEIDKEDGVVFAYSVPQGERALALFIYRSIKAGQRVLKAGNIGNDAIENLFAPHIGGSDKTYISKPIFCLENAPAEVKVEPFGSYLNCVRGTCPCRRPK